ncbi:MAG: hypothetical protein AAGH15_18065 [Myxococcota bacterium]
MPCVASTGPALWLASVVLALGTLGGCQRTLFVADDAAALDGGADASSGDPTGATPPPLLRRTVPASPGTSGRPEVEGLSEVDAEIALFLDAACAGAPALTFVSAGEFQQALDVPANVFVDLSAQATLPGRPASACSNALSYLWDTEGPATPELLATTPASPAPDASITLEGRAEPLARVELFLGPSCSGDARERVADESGAFTLMLDVDRGETVFTARAVDALGNASACSAPLMHTRTLGVTPVFPPAPGATERELLRVRARVDVPPDTRVSFVGPGGARAATYWPDADEWRATVPLVLGPQAIEARVVGEPESAGAPIVDLKRTVFVREARAIAWDDAASTLLVGDGTRVIALDPVSGDASLIVDAGALLEDVVAVAAGGGTTYLLGNGPDGVARVVSWDGTTLRQLARLTAPIDFATERGVALELRTEGDELLVHGGRRAGTLTVDLARGGARPLVTEPLACLAYDPMRDRAVLCLTGSSSGTFRVLDLASGTARNVAIPGWTVEEGRPEELRWDPFAEGFLLHDFSSLSRLDVDAATLEPIPLSGGARGQMGVRGDTGELVFAEGFDSLGTFDPRFPRASLRALLSERVGRGEALGFTGSVATRGDRVFVTDGPRLVEVTLGTDGGERRAVVTGSTVENWVALTFVPSEDRFFAYDANARLLEGSLDGGPIVIRAFGEDTPATPRVGLGIREASGGRPAELLDARWRRTAVLAHSLASPAPPRLIGTVGADESAVAIAHDPITDDVGVLVTGPGWPGLETRLVVVPAAGGEGRTLATLSFPSRLASVQLDLAWHEGRWWATDLQGIVAIDARSGEVVAERQFHGAVVHFTVPDAQGVGYATLGNVPQLVAYDAGSDGYVVIAR